MNPYLLANWPLSFIKIYCNFNEKYYTLVIYDIKKLILKNLILENIKNIVNSKKDISMKFQWKMLHISNIWY